MMGMKGSGPGESKEAPPIEELNDFELPDLDGFTDKVRDSISRTEAASNFVDLSTRGFFRLLLDYLSTILDALFSPADDPHADSHVDSPEGEEES